MSKTEAVEAARAALNENNGTWSVTNAKADEVIAAYESAMSNRAIVVTSETEMAALPIRSIVRDRQGDVFEKVAERGVEMTGEHGKYGLTWVAYPADVLYTPIH